MSPIRLRVRELRIAKGWTQQQLADAAKLDRVTVARLESEKNRRIDYDTLEKIAAAFGEVDTPLGHVNLKEQPGLLIERTSATKGTRKRTR